jgi:hypothetical protein
MGRGLAPVHYLRPNDKVWTPPAVIFLDTETRVIPDKVPETLALRLWDAHYLDRRQSKGKPIRDEWAAGETAAQLVDWIEQVTKGRETVWLYCHNLSFDLITTRLPMRLAERGWFVSDASIGGKSPWMRLGLGKRRLGLFDSGSWLPMPLEEVGKRIGVIKPPLPPDDGSDEARRPTRRVVDR